MEKPSSEIIDFKEMYVQWLFEYYQINMIDKSQQDKAAVTKAKELLNTIRQDAPTNEDRKTMIQDVLSRALEGYALNETKNDFIGKADIQNFKRKEKEFI